MTNYLTILIAVLGAIKLVLGAFGIDIGDEQIDAIVNSVAAVNAIAGVFMTHTNPDDKGEAIRP